MFEYFGQNYVWNMAVNLTLGMGGLIGEIDGASRGLKAVSERRDDEAAQQFFAAWTSLADNLAAQAARDEAQGRALSAGAKYRRCAAYYLTAERMQRPGFAPREAAYRRMLECFAKFLALSGERCERVEVPYRESSLPALFVPAAPAPAASNGRAPCMVHFDGLDVTKEILYLTGMGPALSRRGVSVLIVDNPGVGESLRFRKLHNFPEAEIPAGASIDYLQARAEVDPQRIGIMALSLGGYHAPRAAAFEPRLKCCVAWGANYDWGAIQRMRYETRATSLPIPHYWEHVQWVFGQPTLEEFIKVAERITLQGVLDRITCPILITHGENDRQIALAQAQRTYDECINSRRRELKIHRLHEGGAEHCSIDNLPIGVDAIADWVAENL